MKERRELRNVAWCHPSSRAGRLVNLVMSSDGLQKDGFGSLVLNESEDDSEVVARTARPGTLQLTF